MYGDSTDAQEKLSSSNDESAEEEEEKFNVILSKVGLDKVHTVKAVSEWTGIGVEEAEELFKKVPVLLKKDVALHEAMEMNSVFARERAEVTFTDSIGCSVEIDQDGDIFCTTNVLQKSLQNLYIKDNQKYYSCRRECLFQCSWSRSAESLNILILKGFITEKMASVSLKGITRCIR